MDHKDQITEVSSTPLKSIQKTITYTNITSLEVKHIQEVVDTTYADGSEKQDRHDRSEVHLFVDRDDYTETPEGKI
jgi:hypothetical protein